MELEVDIKTLHAVGFGQWLGSAAITARQKNETETLRRNLLGAKSDLAKERLIVQDLRAQLLQSQAAERDLEATVSKLQAELNERDGNLAESTKRITALNSECDDQLSELKIQLDAIATLTQDVNSLQIVRSAKDQVHAELSRRCEQLTEELEASQKRAEWYKGEYKVRDMQAQRAERAVAKERDLVMRCEARMDRLQRDLADSSGLRADYNDACNLINRLRDDLHRVEAREGTLVAQLTRKEQVLGTCQGHLKYRKEKWDELHTRAQRSEATVTRQAQVIVDLERDLADTRATLWKSGIGKIEGNKGAGVGLGLGLQVQVHGTSFEEPPRQIKNEGASVSPSLYSRLGLIQAEDGLMDAE